MPDGETVERKERAAEFRRAGLHRARAVARARARDRPDDPGPDGADDGGFAQPQAEFGTAYTRQVEEDVNAYRSAHPDAWAAEHAAAA